MHDATVRRFVLELYYGKGDLDLGERSREALVSLVTRIAPNVELETHVLPARKILRTSFEVEGVRYENVPYHGPGSSGRETLLITPEQIGRDGFGWNGCCVVTRAAILRKAEHRGNPADLLIHEWLHTLYGEEIDGCPIPFVDHAGAFGFSGVRGLDGEDTWHEWYRYMLGARR